jgi:hypothetical protein
MKRGPKQKKIYQFNLEGKLLFEYNNKKEVAELNESLQATIKSAIKRKTCFKRRYYFSYEAVFNVPMMKHNFNPLLSKSTAKCGINGPEDTESRNYDFL